MTPLERELALVANVVDRLPDPVLLFDDNLHLVRYNAAFVALSELKNRRLERVFDDAASTFDVVGDPKHSEIAKSCLATGRPTRLEDVEIRIPNGMRRTAVVAFVPVTSLEGAPLGLIYSLRDVSGDVEIHRRYKRLLRQEQERVRVLEARESALKNDLMEAKLFQESLLPAPPQLDGIKISVRFLPAELVSGDLYDIFPIEDGARVLIGDSSGHGVQASLRTMVVRTEYDQIKASVKSPGELLSALNDRFVKGYASAPLHFTACCFDLVRASPRTVRLRCASAGHPGMLRLSGGRVVELRAPGPFPGLFPGVEFAMEEVELVPGDRLLVFTDGFFDQARSDGTQFDEARLSMVLERFPGTVEQAMDRALGELFGFLGEDPQTDDITVIGVEID